MKTEQIPVIRPLTEGLIEALILDTWPSAATRMDFGIESTEHLGALQYAYREDGITPEQFDAALGKGAELQKLISETNPYRFAKFHTVWDHLPTPEELRSELEAD